MAVSILQLSLGPSRMILNKLVPSVNRVSLIRRFIFRTWKRQKWLVKRLGNRNFSDGRIEETNVVAGQYPEVDIPDVPVHEFVFEKMSRFETRTALECGVSSKKWTFRKMLKMSEALAYSLREKFKLQKGERIAIVLPNCPEYSTLLLAGSISGVVPTTVNPTYTAVEIFLQLKDTESKVIFTTPEACGKCIEASKMLNIQIPIVVVEVYPGSVIPSGVVLFSELTAEVGRKVSTPDFRPDDVVVLPYSSGTSGIPKGVQLTHRNLVANLVQFQASNELKANPDTEYDQTFILGVLPMFHIYGMVIVTLDAISTGSRLISLPHFEPKLFMETIINKKAQILYLVPPLVSFLSNSLKVEPEHLARVQHVVTGAAPSGTTDIEKLLQKCQHIKVSQGYGMTETSPVITISHKDRFSKIASVGHPLPSTVVKVADIVTGRALPKGEKGEICVKGPQVMKGYLNRPEETEKAFDADGWLKTGDVGYYDEEYDFYIADRMKELIKVKGFQVAPAELEDFLRAHPKVADVGVIGVKNAQYGEVPKAFVVPKGGVTCTEEEIQDYVKGMLSAHKHLRGGVTFVKEIPKSGAGKILRKNLRLMHDEMAGDGN